MAEPVIDKLIPRSERNVNPQAAKRASEFYDTVLKATLEPKYDGQYVAIHADSLDCVLEKGMGKATRAMREIHADGYVLLRYIRTVDPQLASRIIGTPR